jgi:2-polyprenyl-3-methyl-5-hydroxy-6-metoxy-1,4-benzoquinol methylase
VPDVRSQTLPRELLDSLPAADPRARASRRDLRIFNRLLGNERWMLSILRRHVRPSERVIELGAGDGVLAKKLNGAGIRCDAVDFAPRPDAWPERSRWIQRDVSTLALDGYDGVFANLFLHHFTDAQIGRLGERLGPGTRIIVVGDLLRSRIYEKVFALVCRLVNAHAVSRHDGKLSIRAGFRGDELPRALNLGDEWHWRITCTITGAYRMVALRRT